MYRSFAYNDWTSRIARKEAAAKRRAEIIAHNEAYVAEVAAQAAEQRAKDEVLQAKYEGASLMDLFNGTAVAKS